MYSSQNRDSHRRYTPIADDPRIEAMPDTRTSEEPKEGFFHVKKLSQYGLLFSALVLMFGLGLYFYGTQFATGSRADTEFGPSTVSASELALTQGLSEYPSSYRGNLIPESFVIEAELLHNDVQPESRLQAYVINRIVIYYVLYEELNGTLIIPENYRELESRVPELIAQAEREGIVWQVLVEERLSEFE